jgi:hypothetical protein
MDTTTDGSTIICLDTDKPVAYTTRLLAKYYKHIDDYNNKVKNNLKSNKINKEKEKDNNKIIKKK